MTSKFSFREYEPCPFDETPMQRRELGGNDSHNLSIAWRYKCKTCGFRYDSGQTYDFEQTVKEFKQRLEDKASY